MILLINKLLFDLFILQFDVKDKGKSTNKSPMIFIKYLLLISNLILIFKAYSQEKNGINNDELRWEIIQKEYKNIEESFLNWEIVPKDKTIKGESIKWEIIQKDKTFKEVLNSPKNSFKENLENIYSQNIYEINPINPLNNFIKRNDIEGKVEWKSSFGGGKSGGIGQQNNSIKIDYGLDNFAQLTGIFAEADDDTFNHINGARAQYSWQTYALSLKKKIWDNPTFNSSISLLTSIEYFKTSSGSENTKSIFNEKDNSFNKDKFGKVIYSFALPFTKKINNKLKYNFVTGYVSLPEKLGNRATRNNFYGNNFYIGNGITFDLFEDVNINGSLTHPLGPGNNYFDKNLNFGKKPIYSFGLNWNLNKKISIETKITNGYGSTPATGILTIPSDNLPLYIANFKYSPYGEDAYLKPLEAKDKLISFGGITVNNALIPNNGKNKYSFNIDSKGNYNTSYSYSLSNIFQLELINLGAINNSRNNTYINKSFTNSYLDEDNFNIRLGGKFLLFSPQKNDSIWTSFRTSVGRNESSNQGYLLSELINTFKVNNWLTANLSSKYFYSGIEKFGGFGGSFYLNLSENIQIIPEINYLLDKDLQSNNTISIRYSLSENKSIDLYLSNALGNQDLGQLLRAKDNRIGLSLNLLY